MFKTKFFKVLCVMVLMTGGFAEARIVTVDPLNRWNDEKLTPRARFSSFQKMVSVLLPQYPDSVIVLTHKALKFTRQYKLKREEAVALCTLAKAYYAKNRLPESLQYYNASIRIFERLGDKQSVALMLRNIGILYYDNGFFAKSLEYFQRSLRVSKPEWESYRLALEHIGYGYHKVGDHERAAEYARRVIAHDAKYGKLNFSSYANLATQQYSLRQYAEAEESLKIGFSYIGTPEEKNYHDFVLSYLDMERGNLTQALISQRKLQEIYLKSKDWRMIKETNLMIARIYEKSGQIDKAVEYAEKALAYGKKEKLTLDLIEISDLLTVLYEKQKNYRKAFEIARFSHVLHDSISDNALFQYELSESYFRKSMQDSLKSAEKTKLMRVAHRHQILRHRQWVWGGIIAAVLFLVLSLFIYKNYRKKQKLNSIIFEQNRLLEIEKRMSQDHVLELLAVIESARDFIAFSKDGKTFSYINKAGKELLGLPENANVYDFDDVLDSVAADFLKKEVLPGSREKQFFSGEITINSRSKKPMLLNVIAHRAADGSIFQYSMIARDISDLKSYQQSLQLQNEKLQKTNSELDRFVYSTSHDLRAPITAVEGLIAVLREDFVSDNTDYDTCLDMMLAAVHRTDGIIKNILEYSHNSRLLLKLEPIDVKEIVEEKLEDFSGVLQKEKISTEIHIQGRSMIHADRMRFGILLNNLMDNAIKFQKPENDKKSIFISFQRQADKAVVTITDNGIGMPARFRERAFEMFFRASNASTGSGLGLYVVKEIAELIGATVELQSRQGRGTTVSVIFRILEDNYSDHGHDNAD